jgi:hypothetical protein
MMTSLNYYSRMALVACVAGLISCQEDPKPVLEEEVITTLIVTLTPSGSDEKIELKFFDADGDGSIAPVITPTKALLSPNTLYAASVTLYNESSSPKENMTVEIEEEADHHLFCYDVEELPISITVTDKDSKDLPIGLASVWQTTQNTGDGYVTVRLKHQPNIKTGSCDLGETDIQVRFPIAVVAL